MLPFSSGNLLVSFATLIAAFLCYIILAFIVIPLWKMSFYKKQGIPCYFFPFLGPIFRAQKYAKKFNDSMALPREQAKQDQNLQAEIINFGSHLGIILCDAKIIREFFAHQSDYKKSPFTSDLNLLLGTGLVIAEGDVWKSHRKIISSVFHFDFIKQNIPLIVSTTREFLQEVAKKPLKNVNVMDEIQKITGEVVGRIFFGENLNQYTCRGQILTLYLAQILVKCAFGSKSFLTMILHLMGINSDWIPQNRRVLNEIKDFRELCLKIVQDRKKSNVQTQDLLGLLIKTQASPNPEDRFSDNDIVNEFITFFIAGMDTTGHVVSMALYLLDKNPEYKNTMIEEIEKIYNKTNSNSITVDEINQMEMTHAVVKETLRLYTPVPALFPRRATVDHELMGIKIKKGMSVRTRLLYNFANPKYFEDPDSFKPDRWLNKRQQGLDGFVDIPFSAGARNCIGQHLAMIESKIILAEFMKLFAFKVVPEDYQLVMAFNFLYEPKSKIQMDLKLR